MRPRLRILIDGIKDRSSLLEAFFIPFSECGVERALIFVQTDRLRERHLRIQVEHEDWGVRIRGKLLRLKHPYVFDLIRVMAPHKQCRRGIVLDMLWRNRKNAGLPIPPQFEASAQRALEYYCRDSDVFKKRKAADAEALFCWPKGKGEGTWALIHQNARAWVKRNREALRERLLAGKI